MWSTGLVECRECGCKYIAIEEGMFEEFRDLGCPHCFKRSCDGAEDRAKTDPLAYGDTRTDCNGNVFTIDMAVE